MTVINLSDLVELVPDVREIADLYAPPDDLDYFADNGRLGQYPHQYWSQSLHLAPLEDVASYLTPEQAASLWSKVKGNPEDLYVLLTA